MIRMILIGVGVVSTAIAGYIAKRKLFPQRGEELPPELRTHQPIVRHRRRKARSQFDQALNNGEHDLGPMA